MSELTPQERLFPSLLDRLTDDNPTEQDEPRGRRVFSMEKLRKAVLRDLQWLLNTCHLAACDDLSNFPLVEVSILNYGIPDLTGKTVSGLEVIDVERTLWQAISAFEPRILKHTLVVRGSKSSDSSSANNCLTFEIEGELWSQPIPERLFLKTELDLESGSVTIVEL